MLDSTPFPASVVLVGTALGGAVGFILHFVSVMMDQYGGSVWFEDADPRGTVAVLSFPQSSPNDLLA